MSSDELQKLVDTLPNDHPYLVPNLFRRTDDMARVKNTRDFGYVVAHDIIDSKLYKNLCGSEYLKCEGPGHRLGVTSEELQERCNDFDGCASNIDRAVKTEACYGLKIKNVLCLL